MGQRISPENREKPLSSLTNLISRKNSLAEEHCLRLGQLQAQKEGLGRKMEIVVQDLQCEMTISSKVIPAEASAHIKMKILPKIHVYHCSG